LFVESAGGAAGFGRDPSELLFFNLFTLIVAPTEAEAQRKQPKRHQAEHRPREQK